MFSPQVKQAVSGLAHTAYKHIPSLASPTQMASNLQKVAIPAMTIVGSYLAQGADAFGCIACAVCLLAPGPHCILPCVICGVTIPIPVGTFGDAQDAQDKQKNIH